MVFFNLLFVVKNNYATLNIFLILSPLRHKKLLEVKENERTLGGRKDKKQDSEQKIAIGVAFRFLKIAGGRKARNQKRVP